MGLLDRFRRRDGSAKVRATLVAIEDLLLPDRGSPRDEPRVDDPRYLAAARTLRAALDGLSERERRNPQLGGVLWNELGNTLARQWPAFADEALRAHENAIATAPGHASYLYDLGLCHKYAGRFAQGVELNRRSLRIRSGDEGALWNLGICATGAGDQDAAAEAWQGLGIKVERVDGEVRYAGRGTAQIRISERGPIVSPGDGDPDSFEYLWIARLGPAHGRILSPTSHDFFADVGDVVLHDGAAAGYRDDGERKVPRFPVMALLRRGTQRTFRFAAAQPGRGEIAALEKHLGPGTVYVHTEQVAWLCRACAHGGKVGHQHERLKPDSRIVYGKLVVEEGQFSAFRDKLDGALATRDDLALYSPGLHRASGDEARAVADESAWTALESN
jgi:hypothetical protein